MSLEVKVPVVGESITEVTIAKWLKKDGDQVAMDEIICELESDKATFELPAEAAGILRIVAQEGDTVEIGGILCRIEGNGAATSAAPSQAPTETKTVSDPQSTPVAEATPSTGAQNQPQAPASAPATGGGVKDIKIPAVGESITEVTISKWMKNDGDLVQMDEVLCELESDKATFELPAEAAGILRIVAPEGSTIEIGAVICRIETTGAQSGVTAAPSAPATPAQTQPMQAASSGAATYASGTPSPAAGKILSEKGINAADVQGSGRDGRITKEDAMGAQAKPAAQAAPAAAKPATPSASPAAPTAQPGSRNQRREKMTSLRKTVARRLVQ